MFERWKRRPLANPAKAPVSGNTGEPAISAVLMESTTFPFDAFLGQLAQSQFGGRTPSAVDSNEDGILTFQLDDDLVAIALMPAPYPWSDLEGPCATSWMWPRETPATTLKQHRSHVLLTMIGGQSDRVSRRLILTALTALAAQQVGVMGVCWPEGTLVHYPPLFVEIAKAVAPVASPEAPPLLLWVDFRLFRNPDGTVGMFTTGLKALGHMEIEIPSIQMEPAALREWAQNIIYYLLEKGPVLKDGDTIGITAEQQIKIRHLPSQFGRPDNVLRMGE